MLESLSTASSSVDTIHGPMDESLLEKREGSFDNDNESTSWVEYWLDGELVHRSAHVHLKQGITALMTQGAFA